MAPGPLVVFVVVFAVQTFAMHHRLPIGLIVVGRLLVGRGGSLTSRRT